MPSGWSPTSMAATLVRVFRLNTVTVFEYWSVTKPRVAVRATT